MKVIIVFYVILDREEVAVTRDMIFTVIVYDVAWWHTHALRMTSFLSTSPSRGGHDNHYDIVYDVA